VRGDDGSGAVQLVKGAVAVAGRARFYSTMREAHPALVNGAPGIVSTEAGVPVAVLAFTVAGGRITRIDGWSETRLAGLDLEAFVAS
jgi:RNA polymerase sigma-70 factor (ECF subfamily)